MDPAGHSEEKMRPHVWSTLLLGLLLLSSAVTASAQAEKPPAAPAPPSATAPPTSGFRAEFLGQLAELEKKVVSLAEAMPQEKYTWRPAEGVRSAGEVFGHMARGNYGFPTFVGVQPPAGIDPRGLEKITDKAKLMEALKQSFEHVRQAALKIPDADLDKPTKMFGHQTTVRDVFFTMATHMHEHLGQVIAYARMNGVVPPWTAARQTQQQEKAKQ